MSFIIKLSKIWVWDLEKPYSRSRVKKAPDPPGSRIRNTGFSYTVLALEFSFVQLISLHHPVKFFSFREDKELSAQMFEATAEEDDGDEDEEDEVGMETVSFPHMSQDYQEICIASFKYYLERTPKLLRCDFW